MINMYIGVQGKLPFFLPYFNQPWFLCKDFRKIQKYKLPWKSFQLDSSFSMRKDRETERRTHGRKETTKLTFPFRKSAKAPINGIKFLEVWNDWPSAEVLWSFSRCLVYLSVKFYISGFHQGMSLIHIHCYFQFLIFVKNLLNFYAYFRLPQKLSSTSIIINLIKSMYSNKLPSDWITTAVKAY